MRGEQDNVIPFARRSGERPAGTAMYVSRMPLEDLQEMQRDCKAVVKEREAWLEDARSDLQYIEDALAARTGGNGPEAAS